MCVGQHTVQFTKSVLNYERFYMITVEGTVQM
jgi:hypothetical protein